LIKSLLRRLIPPVAQGRELALAEVDRAFANGGGEAALDAIRRLADFTIDEDVLARTDPHLARIAAGRRVVASFDPTRVPAADEVVIVYGNYPHIAANLVANNPMKRHAADFWTFSHATVESDPRWRGIDRIAVINTNRRRDRLDSVLRELAMARAPFDRLFRFTACDLDPNDAPEWAGHAACLRSHIGALRRAAGEGAEHTLVLEDDFCFTSDLDQHLTDLATFTSRGYDYLVCLVATSKHGSVSRVDDLVSRTQQPCTTTAGYLISRSGIEQVVDLFEESLERLRRTGDATQFAADRCWSVLQPSGRFLVFARKFGFQASGYSDIEGSITRFMD
jgi:hypothetical protein